jgi:transcriptional regulator with XRE-family HTH domain
MEFRDKIKHLLKQKNLKSKDVAKKLGISAATFSNSINKKNITFKTLERIATILNVQTWEIIKPDNIVSEIQLTQKEKELLTLFRSFPDNVNSDIVECVGKISTIFLAGAYYGNQSSKI